MVWDLRCSQWRGFILWSELRHHIVWYVHGYECLGGAFWICLHRPSDDCSSRFRPNILCWPFRLHSPITEQTTISNLNIIHFSCIVSLCYKNLMSTCQAIHSAAILHYTLVWAEMYQRKYNKNSTIYCIMSVCSCFVMILKIYII